MAIIVVIVAGGIVVAVMEEPAPVPSDNTADQPPRPDLAQASDDWQPDPPRDTPPPTTITSERVDPADVNAAGAEDQLAPSASTPAALPETTEVTDVAPSPDAPPGAAAQDTPVVIAAVDQTDATASDVSAPAERGTPDPVGPAVAGPAAVPDLGPLPTSPVPLETALSALPPSVISDAQPSNSGRIVAEAPIVDVTEIVSHAPVVTVAPVATVAAITVIETDATDEPPQIEPLAPDSATTPSAPVPTPDAPAAVDVAAVAPDAAPPATRPAALSATPLPPTFDVARVDTDRFIVLAGSAAPGAEVVIRRGEEIIERTVADDTGDWVAIPPAPLAPGPHELTVESVDPIDLSETGGDRRLVINIQEAESFAVLIDTDAVIPSELLQAPPAVVEDPTPAIDPPPGPEPSAPDSQPSDVEAPQILSPPSPPEIASPTVDAIDYDEAGTVVVSGRARPGSGILLSLDGTGVGNSIATAVGTYQVSPEHEIPPGRYTVSVDQLDDDGGVEATTVIPFERAARADIIDSEDRVVVQPGDYLWRIALETYGSGFRYVVIYQANQRSIDDPDLIYPGQIFTLPE